MIQPFELLETAVSRNPGAIGLVSEVRSFTFLEMLEASRALASILHAKGVRARHVVSTFLPPDLDWICTLAIFHGAAVPVSLWGVGTVSKLNVSWFVSNNHHGSVSKDQTILLDSTAFNPVSGSVASRPRTLYARSDKPMRYVLTSGTTGAPKAVIFTGDNIEARMRRLSSYWADSRPELNFMGLSTTGGFFSAIAALQHGYPYLAEVVVSLSALSRARDQKIQVLAGSPAQIGQALKLLTEHNFRLPELQEIRIAGSLPSQQLVSKIHAELGVSVKSVYGSTEGGGIAVTTLQPGDSTLNLGELVSGIELEIQQLEGGSPQRDGVSGPIRYRGPAVSPGYFEVSSEDRSFIDGWFYPGDVGSISAGGQLVLDGRVDDMLNAGGVKINPETLEDFANKFEGVTDSAVCLVERLPGIEEVAIALVLEKSMDLRGLDKNLRAKFSTGYPTVFVTLSQIPRNRMGKIVRRDVQAVILRELKLN